MDTFFRDQEKDKYQSLRPHPIGRPPLLTSEMIEELCDMVIQGKSIAHSATLCGISESTIYRWLAMGRKPGAEAIYVELVERMGEAVEMSEFEALQVIRKASSEPQHWRSAAWILERRHPEKYGKREVPTTQEKSDGGSDSYTTVA